MLKTREQVETYINKRCDYVRGEFVISIGNEHYTGNTAENLIEVVCKAICINN